MSDQEDEYDLVPVSHDPFPLYPHASKPQPAGVQTASLDPMQAMQLLARRQAVAPTAQSGNAFLNADRFTAAAEGGVTHNDGNGGTAAYGIDQNAHPGMDVTKLTPADAQVIRHGYWQAIGGDDIARFNPHLAQVAYDTAIISGPAKAVDLLRQSGGDPSAYLALRRSYLDGLTKHPQYAGAKEGWANRDAALARHIERARA